MNLKLVLYNHDYKNISTGKIGLNIMQERRVDIFQEERVDTSKKRALL